MERRYSTQSGREEGKVSRRGRGMTLEPHLRTRANKQSQKKRCEWTGIWGIGEGGGEGA